MSKDLKVYISLLVESKLREVDITAGKTAWGSDDHVADLESRISDLTRWRDRQRRGSEARANYSRLISRLRAELASAKRQSAKSMPEDSSSIAKINP
jgi:hypothetical protein